MTWHPPMAYRYSYRTHDGYAMLLADSGGYPRRWIKGPKITWCRTCNNSGEVGRTVALPGHALATTITRYDPCPDCNTKGTT